MKNIFSNIFRNVIIFHSGGELYKSKLKLINDTELFILYICAGLFNINVNQILEFGWLLEITNWSIKIFF